MSDWYDECVRRFPAEREEFGLDKPVNHVQPLVSVCIVTYQHERFIRSCLDSVLMQVTSFPVEIIVGEDESTDGTRAICVEYARKHPDRIRLFLRSRTRSILVVDGQTKILSALWCNMSARGKYVAFLEGDDYWIDPSKLQKQVDLLESRPDVSLCCHRVIMGTDPKAPDAVVYPGEARLLIHTLEHVVIENWIPTGSVVLRREIAQDYPEWTRGIAFGDWPMQVNAAKKGNIAFLDEVMGFYRQHAGGTWSGLGNIRRLQDTLKFYRMLRGQIPRRLWNTAVRPRVAKLKMRLSAEFVTQGDFAGARREAWESLRTDPRVALSDPRKFVRSFSKTSVKE